MRTLMRLACMLLTGAFASAATAQTGEQAEFRRACDGVFETEYGERSMDQLGFWAGEWIVTDRQTGKVRGFDDIKLILEGCAYEQHWRQLSDHYSLQGAPYRMSGKSFTSIDPRGVWRQVWVSSSGGMTHLAGGPDEEGVMKLSTEWQDATRQDGRQIQVRRSWHWKLQDDGSVHSWGETTIRGDGETGEPQVTWDIIYRRNVPGGPEANVPQ